MKRMIGLAVVIAVIGLGCAKTRIYREGQEKPRDLSGRWNDTDSKMVAEKMIKDVLSRPWLSEFHKNNGKNPTVIVGTIINKSYEHINIETFVKDIEMDLTNSGRVTFVANKSEREEIRDERKEQADFSDPETVKRFKKEMGADYMLKGTINTILDEKEGIKVIFYQVDLELIDIESNVKVWLGQEKYRKVTEK